MERRRYKFYSRVGKYASRLTKTHLSELAINLRCNLCVGVDENGACKLLLSVTALMGWSAIKFKSFAVFYSRGHQLFIFIVEPFAS